MIRSPEQMRRLSLTGIIAAALWVIWLMTRDAGGPPVAEIGAQSEAGKIAHVAAGGSSAGEGQSAPKAQPPIVRDSVAPPKPELHVRLRGLRPDLPWTGLVKLGWTGRRPDGRGIEKVGRYTGAVADVVVFDMPEGFASASLAKGSVTGIDANYRAAEVRWEGPRDAVQEVVLDVFPSGRIKGKVVGANGIGVDAQIVAFAMRDGRPTDERLAATSTRFFDPGFVLQVPLDTPVFVVAVADNRDVMFDVRSFDRDADGLRSDFLPVGKTAATTLGKDVELGTIELPACEPLRGRVLFEYGDAVNNVAVRSSAAGRVLPVLQGWGTRPICAVTQLDNGTLVPCVSVLTSGAGHFDLPAVPGVAMQLSVEDGDGSMFGGWRVVGVRSTTVTSTQPVVLRLPAPRTVRIVEDGSPAGGMLEFAGQPGPVRISTRLGVEQVVIGDRITAVRAVVGSRSSAWKRIDAGAPSEAIDLAIEGVAATLGDLHIDLRSSLLSVHLRWSGPGGEGEKDLSRPEPIGAFAVQLPLGTNHLTLTDPEGWLLPIHVDAKVEETAQTITVQGVLGGRLSVFCNDDGGRNAPGLCTVIDESGVAVGAPFEVQDGMGLSTAQHLPGELVYGRAAGVAGLLPEGHYRVLVRTANRELERQPVAIRAGERTELHLRLP